MQFIFDAFKQQFPETVEKIVSRLSEKGIIRIQDNNMCQITNLGAILFARDLKKFDGLYRKAPRLIAYSGKDKLKTMKDTTGSKGYAIGFSGLVETIKTLLPSNEIIRNALREDVEMYPEYAIRELVANALIHQDFEDSGSTVTIEIFSNRMEISNPGAPLVETDRFVDEYKTRNDDLADIMRQINICEERSSGVDKVIKYTEIFQLPAPKFRATSNRTIVILFAHKPFDEMDTEERVRACYLHCCLKYVSTEDMTNQTLRERFGLPENKSETVSRVISDAVNQGRIVLKNPDSKSRRYTKYIPYWA